MNDLRFDLPEWHLQAACRGMDPMLFFPDKGVSAKKALAVCAVCPVQPECLDEALSRSETESLGIWGGTRTRQRRALRRARQPEKKPKREFVPGSCTVCGGPTKALGLCNRHYQRLRTHGDPNYQGPGRGAHRKVDLELLAALDHLTQNAAAKILGCHESTVGYWRARLAESPDARGSVSGDRQ